MSYTEKLDKALAYAADLHRDQVRKGTCVPYVTHLLAVAAIVGENGGTESEVIAALLHDAPRTPAASRDSRRSGPASATASPTSSPDVRTPTRIRNRPGASARRIT